MKSTRRIQLLAVTTGMLAATAFALPSAGATTPAAGSAKATPEAVASVTAALGADSTAGSYYDSATKTTVVNVTSQAAADTVRAAGATPRLVAHSSAQLAKAGDATKATDIAGTAKPLLPGVATSSDILKSVDEATQKALAGGDPAALLKTASAAVQQSLAG